MPSEIEEREKNGVPVLERMMEIFTALEARGPDDSVRGLSERLKVPRSTVYRILNSLSAHGMVHKRGDGTFALGHRLITLAEKARSEAEFDLISLATPVMRRMAEKSGQAAKISVVINREAMVVAAVPGTAAYALNPATGRSFPLHAGAASKLLMAHLPKDEQAALLAGPLSRHTEQTVTDAAALAAELSDIRQRGWASDQGEHGISVGAVAAPVFGAGGEVVAAMSIPFLNLEQDAAARAGFLELVIAAAADLTRQIAAASSGG